MKEFKIIGFLTILIAAISLQSCLKSAPMNIDSDNKTAGIVELQFIQPGGSTINSGMTYFSGAALTYPAADMADTANYNISLGGANTLGKDLTVSLAADATKLLDNFSSDSISYQIMPDSIYHIISAVATIKAGMRIANMQIVYFPSKIDITKSYMLPITIKDAQGQIISSNFSTIYFHIIGNPIAGNYNHEWIRYNNLAGTGTPAYDKTFADGFAPVNPTTINVVSGSAGLTYVVTFKNTNGVLSNFKAVFTAASVAASGVTITGNPVVTVADPVNHNFSFNFTYSNSAGSPRNITDNFTR